MKKALTLIAILCMATMLFAGCDSLPFPLPSVPAEPSAPACEHDWEDATCTTPKTCSLCQVTEGEALGHTGGTATCTDEAVCTRCEKPYGEKAEHTWTDVEKKDATCTEDGYTAYKACTCGAIEGKTVIPAAHTWTDVEQKDATCTEDGYTAHKACTCGATEGKTVIPAGHTAKADDGDVTTAVTCERCDHIFVEAKEAINLTIGTFENGAVVTDKKNYAVGEKVALTITPADGYAQKLYINGEPLMLDWKTNTYTFIAEEGKTYAITGSFEPGLKLGAADKWDAANQAHGILNTYYTSGDSGWYWIDGEYASLSAIVKNYDSANADGFFTMLCFKINNVNYNFRVIKQGGKYYCQRAGFKVNGKDDWTKKELDADTVAAILGEGVEFKMVRTAADTLTVSVNGKVYDVFTLTGDAVSAKVTKVCIGHDGNENKYVTIPFALTVPSDEPPVENDVKIEIPAFTNGTVAADKEGYSVGDTVALVVTPNAGYVQKLYINGEPLVLDWKTNVYTFTVEEGKTYAITGSFEPSLFNSNDKWDAANQAHGLLETYYTSGDSGWYGVNGEYASISAIVKNYDEAEADGFGVVLIMKINDKNYNFRIKKESGVYYCQRAGFTKPAGGSDWTKFALDADAVAAIRGEGAEFKMEHNNGVLTLSVNGKVYDTYTLPAADSYKVSRASLCSEGNLSLYVTIPFELTPVAK